MVLSFSAGGHLISQAGSLPSPSLHILSKHCSTGAPSPASSGGSLTSPSLGQTEVRAPSSSLRIFNSLPGSGLGP